ncbi:MAG: ABC transporter ATP-binding protein, partial [Deltaproteobacteria bacterium]
LEMGGYLISEASRRKERMDRIFEQLPFLHEKRKRAARSLSGGERQLLAIGMGLMTEPDLLLLDEPSMGLSPRMMSRVFSWIMKIHEAGKSILMVEQNAKQALELAHRGYVLDLGTNRFEGRARDLLDDPKVKRLYLGGGEMDENLS